MRCLNCHYSLENLTQHRCPECGREFDPTDPATFDDGSPRVLTLRGMLHILIICYVVNLGLTTYLSLSELSPRWAMLVRIPLASAVILIFTFPIGLILYGCFSIIRRSVSGRK